MVLLAAPKDCALLLFLVLIAFSPALLGGFVWDDVQYVERNPLLEDSQGLKQIWLSPKSSPQYYPLTFTTFWVEHHLWGLHPFGYHLDNLFLHAANSLLLWLLLRRIGVPGAWFAALVWAIHPVRVESVAWISERKDVLSGFFCLASLLAWVSHLESNTRKPLVISLLLFSLALLAKTAVCPLPIVLLLVAWWREGCLSRSRIAASVPFFVLALLMAGVVIVVEQESIDVARGVLLFSVPERMVIAGRAWCFYILKTLWPVTLMAIYPRWTVDASRWQEWGWVLSAIAALAGLWALRRRIGSGGFAAAAAYTVMILPALGFVSLAFNRFSFVADHFQYLAGAGLIVLGVSAAAGALAALEARCSQSRLLMGVVVALLLPLTFRHALLFRDSEALFRDNLVKNPESWGVHTALGAVAMGRRGGIEEAVHHFAEAARIDPRDPQSHYNLAVALESSGKREEAEASYNEALRIAPDYAEAHNNLGILLNNQGKMEEALRHFSEAARIKPQDPRFEANRVEVLRRLKRG